MKTGETMFRKHLVPLLAVSLCAILTAMPVSAEEIESSLGMLSSGTSGINKGGGFGGTSVPTQGIFSFTGAATAAIPIVVPPGRGVAPQLSLRYNSYKGNGWVGVGWNIDVDAIERSTKYGVDYSAPDFVAITNGSPTELVQRSDWGADYYGAKTEEGFTKYRFNGPASGWVATTKDGTRYYFGTGAASRQDNAHGVFKWCLDRVEDPNGNYMIVTYTKDQGQIYLERIEYTGNGSLSPTQYVKFYLESRPDVTLTFTTNAAVKTLYRLKTIEVNAGGARARAYKLTYAVSGSTARSLLISVQQYGADATLTTSGDVTGGTALPPMTFGWDEEKTHSFTTEDPFSTTDAYDMMDCPNLWAYGDFNGDGRTDIIYYTRTGYTHKIKFSNGDGTFTDAPTFYTYDMYGGGCYYPTCWAYGDFNGDGKTDIIYHTTTSYAKRIKFSNGDGTFTDGPEFYITDAYSWDNPDLWGFGDFNGDGRTDIIYHTTTPYAKRIKFSNGDGTFTDGPLFYTNDMYTGGWGPDAWNYGDFNGDGKIDIIYYTSTRFAHKIKFSNGDGTFTDGPKFYTNDMYSGEYPKFWAYGDFNGDGRTDIIYYPSTDYAKRIKFSNGDGTFTDGPLFYTYDLVSWESPRCWAYGDFNGDGKTDIIYHTSTNYTKRIKFSNGDGTFTDGPPFTTTDINDWDPAYWAYGDFNGDGRTDVIYQTNSTDHGKRVRFSNVGMDLILTINNGLGATTTMEYTPSCHYANTSLPYVLQTLSKVTVDDGLGNLATTEYTYANGLIDYVNREFRGFEYAKGTNPDGTRVETWYHQDDYRQGRQYQVDLKQPGSGLLLSRATVTWEQYPAVPPAGTYAFVKLVQKYTESYDSVTTVYTQEDYTYDNTNGNLVSKVTSGTDGEAISQTNTYQDYGAWLWRLTRETVIGAASGPVRETSYGYDNRGNMISKALWLDGGTNPIVSMTYDSYGNKVTETDARGDTTTIDYDATTHTYPVKITAPQTEDGKPHIVEYPQYDYRFGQATKKKDERGYWTSFAYDVFGRPMRVDYPDGGQQTTLYYDTASPRYTLTKVKENASGQTANTYQYFDGLGRKIGIVTFGENAKQIDTTTHYDTMGRVYRTEGPYFNPKPAAYPYVETIYDYRGRPIQVSSPDGSYGVVTTIYSYSGLSTTTIDPDGKSKTEKKDYLGRVIQVTEHADGSELITTYVYNAAGDLVRVTDAAGNMTTISYDTLGRKIAMDDPDMGYWEYVYDANGNLISETNERRLIRAVTDSTKIYNTYDEMGRVKTEKKIIGGSTTEYTTQYQYDLAGKPLKTTYPDGYEVSYAYYPGSGLLATVTGSDSAVYASCTLYEPIGKMGQVVHGNATATRYTYDPSSTRLTGVVTADPSGQPANDIQRREYTYSRAGDILAILDDARGITYTYAYDKLHRLLTESNTSSYDPIHYAYNAIGNITQKTVGATTFSYVYDTAHKHAIKAITVNGQNYQYTYDEVGNMTAGPDFTNTAQVATRTMAYYADDKPATITHTAGGSTVITNFLYDGDGNRAKKQVQGGSITYHIGEHYEVKDGVVTKYIFAGNLRVAMVKGTTLNYFHKDHLSSSTAMTDAAGAVIEQTEYVAFGLERDHAGEWVTDYKFTDQELDPESGLYNYDARLYDPAIGRFMTPDSMVPDVYDPQALNHYSYCRNNPLIYVDPTGHWFGWLSGFFSWFSHGSTWDTGRERTSASEQNWEGLRFHTATDQESLSLRGPRDYSSEGIRWGSGAGGTHSATGTPWPWLFYAESQLGVKEIAGSKHNDIIVGYHKTTGGFKDDETPWCSSFANWSVIQSNIKGTNSALALSWLTWGQQLNKPAYASIGIIDYGRGRGHVGFVVGLTKNDSIVLLGGNQSDSVQYSAFSREKFARFVYPSGYIPSYVLQVININNIKEGSYGATR